jgi:flagellin
MALSIRTNLSAITAAGNLARNTTDLTQSMRRVSSGRRMESAADMAAGLGVSTSLETAGISTRQAMRNANDGISLIQTAESSGEEVTDILQRMRELAVQSSSETLADRERSFVTDEFNQLRSEIARVAGSSEFNGIQLSDGQTTSLSVQVGIGSSSDSRMSILLTDLTTSGLGVDSIAVGTSSDALTALAAIDTALQSINSGRSQLGSVQNRLDSSIQNSMNYSEALGSAEAGITDTDYAEEVSHLTRFQIMQQAGIASLAQAKNVNSSMVALLA